MKRRWAWRLGAISASAGACALYATAEPSWHWLGWVVLVPWLVLLDAEEGAKGAMLDAWVFSAAFAAAALWWFPGAIARYVGVPAVASWAVMLGLAPLLEPQWLVYAGARWLGGRALGRWVAPLACVGAEWAFPKLVPDTLGFGLYPSQDLRQLADLGGVPLLTLLLLWANEALVFAARERRRPRVAAVAVALVVAAVLSGWGYGRWRRSHFEGVAGSPGGRTVTAGLVQTNLTRYAEMANRDGMYETVVRILEAHGQISAALAKSEPLDLLVWPETAYPTTYGEAQSEAGAELDEQISSGVKLLSVPLLFGTYEQEAGREYNAAVLLGADAARLGSYRKTRLFPLTEWVPQWLEWARGPMPWMGTWWPGPGARVLQLPLRGGGAVSIAPLICYDAMDAGVAAEARRLGAQALVTLSNDSWFAGTPAMEQHLIGSAYRSVETRLPQVRATPSGVTASISVTGDVLLRVDPDRPAGLIAEMEGLPAPGAALTLAARWGNWLGPVSLAAAAAALALRAVATARRRAR